VPADSGVWFQRGEPAKKYRRHHAPLDGFFTRWVRGFHGLFQTLGARVPVLKVQFEERVPGETYVESG
jgi:hypothetical protein